MDYLIGLLLRDLAGQCGRGSLRQHKLRVTNSIEAFVAAVRAKEQEDLVLAKLVESVTEFSDPGIIGKQGEASGFSSVVFEPLIKNIGKSD